MSQDYKRGDVVSVDLGKHKVGSEQYGLRPAVVVQNNLGNKHSPTLIVVLGTSSRGKKYLPTHVEVSSKDSLFVKDTLLLCEQIVTIDKARVRKVLGSLHEGYLSELDDALEVSLGIERDDT